MGVSISNDYNSPKCAYIISGEGYIEWNDFTSDTLYTTTTTPTKERNISKLIHLRERAVWRAGTPDFLSRRENNGTTVYRMGRVCIRRLVPPPSYIHIRPICQTAYAIRLKLAGDPEWMDWAKKYTKKYMSGCAGQFDGPQNLKRRK